MPNREHKKYSRIAVTLLVIGSDASRGHLKWTVGQIALASQWSRSLIYYHFGKSKSEILRRALGELLDEFYGLNDSRRGWTIESCLAASHTLYKAQPLLSVFFQKWRHSNSFIGTTLIEAEDRYEKKLRCLFPSASPSQIRSIHAVFHGLVTAPYLESSDFRSATSLLNLDALK